VESPLQTATGGFEILTLDFCGGWIGSIDLTRVMTVIHGSRAVPFLSPGTMTEYTADPGLPDWNTDPRYWYGLGIFVGGFGAMFIRSRAPKPSLL
jgi:hypothetical protein